MATDVKIRSEEENPQRLKAPLKAAISAVVILGLGFAIYNNFDRVGFALFQWMGRFEVVKFDEEHSPDGEWITTAYTVRGGVLSSIDIYVNVRRAERKFRHYGGHTIFLGFFKSDVDIEWINERRMNIKFAHPEVSIEDIEIMETTYEGLVIQYEFSDQG